MGLNIGSMLIKAKFDAGNIMTGLSGMSNKLKESTLTGKSLRTEFMRMKGTLTGLAAVAGLSAGVLLGMLTNAVMKSPFLAAALEKLKNEFMLFGNAIAKYVAPILEKVVDLVRWLRQKFEALPEPMRAMIVKGVILAGAVLALIGVLTTLGLFLGAAKLAFIALGGTAIVAKLGAITAAIWTAIAGSVALGVAVGIVTGLLGVMAMDRSGVGQWIADKTEGFRNWDSAIRDLIVSFGELLLLIGGGAIDITRGDWEFSRAKAGLKQSEEARERIKGYITGSYSYGQGSTTTDPTALGWEGYKASKTVVENQTVEIHNDFTGLTGDMSDPVAVQEALDRINTANAEYQQSLSV